MALLVIRHDVHDYKTWKDVYDSMSEMQHQWGVTEALVYQLDGAPNTVLVLHQFATVAQAHGFLTNRELQNAMRQGGVEGTPRIEIYA